jgi:hypothetical protein
MHSLRHNRFTCLWLVLAFIVVGQLGGAHLHLCFDGQEPASAVHMSDGDIHDDAHHLENEHVDKDVELFNATMVSKADFSSDLLIPCCGLLLFLLPLPVRTHAPPTRAEATAQPAHFFLRPPLRGPPTSLHV